MRDFEELVEFMEAEHILWCRHLIDSLNLGGTWEVPRSGLTFTKTGPSELTLTGRVPPIAEELAEMPGLLLGTPEFAEVTQSIDIHAIVAHFAAAGVEVVTPGA